MTQSRARTSRLTDALTATAIVALTFALYFRVAHFDFVNFDDGDYVTENRVVKQGLTWDGVVWAFTTSHAANWHPLTWLSHMLDVQVFDLHAGAHHLVNVALHATNAALLFIALRMILMDRRVSAFIAVVFAVHPLHVESVAWISERKDVLSALLWMLTIIAYVAYVHHPGWWRYFLTIMLLALGLMCKPMLVTLPFVLLLLDLWPLKRPDRRGILLEKLPMIGVVIGSCAITYIVQSHAHAVARGATFSLPLRLANAIVSYARYLRMTFAPHGLAAFYPHVGTIPGRHLPALVVAGAFALLVVITAVAILARRRMPWLIVGWLWYLGTLVPVIGILQVGEQALADRYMYIPMIGLLVAIACTVDDVTKNRRLARAALAVACVFASVACFAISWRQIGYWRDSETLMRHALAVTHDNYTAHDNLGEYLGSRGDFAAAAEQYRQTLEIRPNDPVALNNLAGILSKEGKPDDAIELYERAIRADSHYPGSYTNYGKLLEERGQTNEAIANYRKAIAEDSEFAPAYNNLAYALAGRGELSEAMKLWRRALELDPDHAQAHHGLGLALLAQGQLRAGIDHLRRSLSLQPDQSDALTSLAWVLATTPRDEFRDCAEAERLARRACELTRNEDPVALDTLATALACNRKFDEATTTADAATSIARRQGKSSLADSIAHRAALYRAGRPFVQ